MVRISSLILSIKYSPFVPIKLYRDLPRPREFLSDQSISTTPFSLSPLRALATLSLAKEERARDHRNDYNLPSYTFSSSFTASLAK
jgi:hypothetical protein